MYPSLTYRDIGAALAWLEEAFGFEGRVLDEVGAMMTYRGGVVLIQLDRPKDLHGSHSGQGWVYVVIDDADAHYERAKAAGADLCKGSPTTTATATAATAPATSKETSGVSTPLPPARTAGRQVAPLCSEPEEEEKVDTRFRRDTHCHRTVSPRFQTVPSQQRATVPSQRKWPRRA